MVYLTAPQRQDPVLDAVIFAWGSSELLNDVDGSWGILFDIYLVRRPYLWVTYC